MLKEEACLNNTGAYFDEKEFTLIKQKLARLIEKLGLDLKMWFCLVQNWPLCFENYPNTECRRSRVSLLYMSLF